MKIKKTLMINYKLQYILIINNKEWPDFQISLTFHYFHFLPFTKSKNFQLRQLVEKLSCTHHLVLLLTHMESITYTVSLLHGLINESANVCLHLLIDGSVAGGWRLLVM